MKNRRPQNQLTINGFPISYFHDIQKIQKYEQNIPVQWPELPYELVGERALFTGFRVITYPGTGVQVTLPAQLPGLVPISDFSI